MGTKLPQTSILVQKVVQTCQFADTIEYIQPTQNNVVTIELYKQLCLFLFNYHADQVSIVLFHCNNIFLRSVKKMKNDP